MGVKLSEIIPREPISFDLLAGKIIAIDTSNMLFQFLTSIRQSNGNPLMDSRGNITSHLVGISSRISNLVSKGIKPCFIFDGKPPKQKYKERERRASIKKEASIKYKEAEELGDEDNMLKYSRMSTHLTKEIIEESKLLLNYMGLPVIQAPSEAEAQAAYMCRKKHVWAVASSDYDCLLYQCPRMITNLTLSQKRRTSTGLTKNITPELIELSKVLSELEIDHKQLIVLAILVGTDYNIGGVKGIGPKKALKLVQSDKSFDTIFKDLGAEFDWKEIFNIFENMPTTGDYKLEFKEPDRGKIKELLIDEHEFSESRVDSMLENLSFKKDKAQTVLNKWF